LPTGFQRITPSKRIFAVFASAGSNLACNLDIEPVLSASMQRKVLSFGTLKHDSIRFSADNMARRSSADTMKTTFHTTRAMILLGYAAFASAAAIRVCDPMLPEIAHNFGTTNGQAAGTITAFAVAYGVFQLLYGPIGDRYNKYRLIALATFACTVGSLSAAASPYLNWLIASRALAGATAAAIIPMSIAWIGDNVPYVDRQETLARFISGPILGLIGGQFLGGFVADTLGWRWCFVLLAAMYVLTGVLLQRELRHNSSVQSQALLASAPTSQPAFLNQFINVLRVRWTRVILMTAVLESFTVFGSVAFIPVYLHTRFGISLTAAGAIMAVFGLGGLFYTVNAGRLVARIGERGLAAGGGILLGAAFLVFLLSNSWAWAIPASLMTGTGFYMLHNTLQTNATQMVPFARGTAVAMFVAFFFLGQSAGVAIGATIVDSHGASWLFASSAAALPLIGIGFAFILRYRTTEDSADSDLRTEA
jgi:predicted MFS family arabinose efflux permease